MKYKLRYYQEEAVKKGIEFFNDKKNKKNSIIVLPTGSGKSLVIANIAKKLNGKTIIFQPSKELLEQNFEKYISYGEHAEIYSASANRKKISNVTFATIGSVVNKSFLFDEFKFCIVDECHLVSPNKGTMYKTFFDNLNLKVLGLTATPIRMKRYNFPIPHSKICMLDRMKPKFFNEYLHITQISEMKENNYFADLDYISFDFNRSMLKINTTGGDYTEKSISYALKTSNIIDKISNLFNDIQKKGVIKHVLVFVSSIEDAFLLQKKIGINKIGIVTGSTNKKERKEILKSFKDGVLKAVVNVGVLTTGFDFPELDCIISARPTMSLGLYYQIVGRAVRPHLNKKKAYIIDFVGNYIKFGRVEDLKIEKKENLYVIHNGKNILTNIDISENSGNIIEEDVILDDSIITFGKYKDEKLVKIPNHYLKWVYENVTRKNDNEYIFKYIEEKILIN